MKKRTGAARTLLCAALLCCAGTLRGQDAAVGEEQYTLRFSGCLEGTVTVRRDSAGKVTVTPKLSGEGDY
ncbi:MAG: hypothetical protein LBP23_10460, partial [Treponema sp.]|nr:hypothetical protein [Treponema sp.]